MKTPRAKRHRQNDGRIGEIGRRSDTENAFTRASAEKDAEHRSGSKYPEGWGAPPGT